MKKFFVLVCLLALLLFAFSLADNKEKTFQYKIYWEWKGVTGSQIDQINRHLSDFKLYDKSGKEITPKFEIDKMKPN